MLPAAHGAAIFAIVGTSFFFCCACCWAPMVSRAVPKMPSAALNWTRVSPSKASCFRITWDWIRFVLMITGIFSGFLTLPLMSIVSLHYAPIVRSDETVGVYEPIGLNGNVTVDSIPTVRSLPEGLRNIYEFGQVVLWSHGAEVKYYAMWTLTSIFGGTGMLALGLSGMLLVTGLAALPLTCFLPILHNLEMIESHLARFAINACFFVYALVIGAVLLGLVGVLLPTIIMCIVMYGGSFVIMYFGLISTAVSTLLAPLNCVKNAHGILVMAASPQYVCASHGKDAFLAWLAGVGSAAIGILLSLEYFRDIWVLLGLKYAVTPDGTRYVENIPSALVPMADQVLKNESSARNVFRELEKSASSQILLNQPPSEEDNTEKDTPLLSQEKPESLSNPPPSLHESTSSPEHAERPPSTPHPIPPGMVMPWLSMSLTSSNLIIGITHLLRPDGADESADTATAVLGVILPAMIGLFTLCFDVATNRIMAVAIQVSLVGVTIINITSLSLFLHEITDVGATTYQWVFVATSILCLVIIVVFAIYHLRNHPVNIPAFILEGKVIVDSSPGHKNRFEDPPTPEEHEIEL